MFNKKSAHRKKKHFGQHFLRWQSIANEIVNHVALDSRTHVMEIGCGDGFLTRTILAQPIESLTIFEIDPDWANYIKETIADQRLNVVNADVLHVDFDEFSLYQPWVLLANLPYQITFPILHKIKKERDRFKEGVIMVQEEVAQKILKTSGRGYGYNSLFFQRYFEWKKLSKVPPQAFNPPPKVNSRLLYFMPKKDVPDIAQEQKFWKFIKLCFSQPRRTLKNNLIQSHIDMSLIPEEVLAKRAQELSMVQFQQIWSIVLDCQ